MHDGIGAGDVICGHGVWIIVSNGLGWKKILGNGMGVRLWLCHLTYKGETCSRIWHQKLVPETCASFLNVCHAFLRKFFSGTRNLSVCHLCYSLVPWSMKPSKHKYCADWSVGWVWVSSTRNLQWTCILIVGCIQRKSDRSMYFTQYIFLELETMSFSKLAAAWTQRRHQRGAEILAPLLQIHHR